MLSHVLREWSKKEKEVFNVDNDNNKKVSKEKITENKKTFVSEVQEFKKPEGYDDAFKEYYPKEK